MTCLPDSQYNCCIEALNLLVTEESYWAHLYMSLYTFLHPLLWMYWYGLQIKWDYKKIRIPFMQLCTKVTKILHPEMLYICIYKVAVVSMHCHTIKYVWRNAHATRLHMQEWSRSKRNKTLRKLDKWECKSQIQVHGAIAITNSIT
jgi:hypothetical protein